MTVIHVNELDLIDEDGKRYPEETTFPLVVRLYKDLDCIAECHFETVQQAFAFLRTTPEGRMAVLFDTHFNKRAVYMLS